MESREYLGAREVELEAVSQRLSGLLLVYHDVGASCLELKLSDGSHSYSSTLKPSQVNIKGFSKEEEDDDDMSSKIQHIADHFLSRNDEIPNISVTYDVKVPDRDSVHVSIRKKKGGVTAFLLKPHKMERDGTSSSWNKTVFQTLQQREEQLAEARIAHEESQSKLQTWKETAERLEGKMEQEKEHVTDQFFKLYRETYNKLKETTEQLKLLQQQQDSLYHGSGNTTTTGRSATNRAAGGGKRTSAGRGKRKRKTVEDEDDPPEEALLDATVVDRLAGDLEEPVSIDSQIDDAMTPPKSSSVATKKRRTQESDAEEEGKKRGVPSPEADNVASSSQLSQPRHNPLTGAIEVHEASQVFDTKLDATLVAPAQDEKNSSDDKVASTTETTSMPAASSSDDKPATKAKKKKKKGKEGSQEDKAKMLALLDDW